MLTFYQGKHKLTYRSQHSIKVTTKFSGYSVSSVLEQYWFRQVCRFLRIVPISPESILNEIGTQAWELSAETELEEPTCCTQLLIFQRSSVLSVPKPIYLGYSKDGVVAEVPYQMTIYLIIGITCFSRRLQLIDSHSGSWSWRGVVHVMRIFFFLYDLI